MPLLGSGHWLWFMTPRPTPLFGFWGRRWPAQYFLEPHPNPNFELWSFGYNVAIVPDGGTALLLSEPPSTLLIKINAISKFISTFP